MAYEVTHAVWHFWQPGQRYEPDQDDEAEYQKYVKRASKRGSDARLLLLALALDARPIEPPVGDTTEAAECYTSLDNLAERIQRSVRTTQRLLRELKRWGELDIWQCNGRCFLRGHRGTNHYILYLPDGAQPWLRSGRREGRYRYGKAGARSHKAGKA